MADDGYDGLPMYVVEEEEEAAAAEKQKQKQKRRQQGRRPIQRPPSPPVSPEEMARREINDAMCEKLREYDPKFGSTCYSRVWFLDFTKFDLDEETQYGPMRFTDSPIGEGHELTDSLNVLCLKIMSSDVGFPINVYGTVIIRDNLDMKCNYVFRRDRDNCQLVKSQGESLILTGPSRGVVFLSDAYFEIDLKIREGRESDDMQFNKAMIDVDGNNIIHLVPRVTVASWLSEVDLIFAHVKKALEGTIEITKLSGPESFHGKITACTTDVPDHHMLLYDSDVGGAVTVGDGTVIQLLRRVVSVSADKMLVFHIWSGSDAQNANITHCISEFTPMLNGADRVEIACGPYKLRVKVVWSTLPEY